MCVIVDCLDLQGKMLGDQSQATKYLDICSQDFNVDDDFIRKTATSPRNRFLEDIKKELKVSKGSMAGDKRKKIEQVRKEIFDRFVTRFENSSLLKQLGPVLKKTCVPIGRLDYNDSLSDIHVLCQSIEDNEIDEAIPLLTLAPFDEKTKELLVVACFILSLEASVTIFP